MEQTIDKLFDTLNMVRSTPQVYAARLDNLRSRFRGDIYCSNSKQIRTFEGVKPLDQLIQALNVMRPIKPLKWSFSLHVVADQQAQYLGNSGLATHQGPGGTKLPERVAPYAIINGRVNQVIELGSSVSSQILMDLLVDDGLVTRKRRRALLDPNYEYIGIAWGMHKQYGFCTVIVLADNVSELIQPNGKLIELNKIKTTQDLQQNFYKVLPNPKDHQLHHVVQEESVIETIPVQPPMVHSQSPPLYQQGIPPRPQPTTSSCSIM